MAGLDTLDGAVAVVTGGASGIGRATALAFARRGAAVAVADVNTGRLAETVQEVTLVGGRALAVTCDVTDDDAFYELAQRVREDLGEPDVVVLNAGVSVSGPPDRIPLDDWRATFEVNFYGVLRGINAFVPSLRRRGAGNVVITASVAGRYAYSFDAAPYIASKFAVYGLAETLALYLRPQGIDVTVVCPGLVRTNMAETARRAGIPPGAPWGWFPFAPESALAPEEVAEQLVTGMLEGRFLVYTHPEEAERIARRGADVDADLARQLAIMPDPTPPPAD